MTDASITSNDDGLPAPTPGRCNARRRQGPPGGLCREPAGKGTGHLGTGRCRRHGGNAPTGQIAAAREYTNDQFRRFGEPLHVRPSVALVDEVARTSGMIKLIEDEVARVVDETGRPILVDTNGMNPAPNPLVLLYIKEREHLVRAARTAIESGVEVEMESVATAYADRILDVVERVVGDVAGQLGLDPDSPMVVEAIGRALARFVGDEDRLAIGGVA